ASACVCPQGPQKSIQERFWAVWSRLHLSQEQTMDMAAKYSTHKYQMHTRKALSLWERACTVIEEREEKLEDLLTFEKSASNPSRLFAKGKDGSSESRLHEAKRRKQIHSVGSEKSRAPSFSRATCSLGRLGAEALTATAKVTVTIRRHCNLQGASLP
ncbi:Coiled-coil domain-containing protein 87, partial [Geodia barretti]